MRNPDDFGPRMGNSDDFGSRMRNSDHFGFRSPVIQKTVHPKRRMYALIPLVISTHDKHKKKKLTVFLYICLAIC